jgi:hypothetical protein
MGCLTFPLKLVLVLLLVAGAVAAWLYRDRIVAGMRGLTQPAAAASRVGRPTTRALAAAESKIDSLNGWRADSVVLAPDEAASLIGSALYPAARRQLDSMRVTLGDGQIDVTASLATARLPRELLGPLAVAVRPREPIAAGGPIRITAPGQGEWEPRRFRIRDFPLPTAAVPRLVGRALGDSTRRTLPLRIPAGVRGLRVRPDGITLYGTPR